MSKTRQFGENRMFKDIAKKRNNPPKVSQNHRVWVIQQRKKNLRKLKGGRIKPHNRPRGHK